MRVGAGVGTREVKSRRRLLWGGSRMSHLLSFTSYSHRTLFYHESRIHRDVHRTLPNERDIDDPSLWTSIRLRSLPGATSWTSTSYRFLLAICIVAEPHVPNVCPASAVRWSHWFLRCLVLAALQLCFFSQTWVQRIAQHPSFHQHVREYALHALSMGPSPRTYQRPRRC